MSASVEAAGVRKEYGDLVAVEDLTFAVERGEILGVLGPNGAGKTTAIRVLTTILAPTRGTLVVAGVPHTRPADIRRRIGVLPESAGYPEQQTGEEFLRCVAHSVGRNAEPRTARRSRLPRHLGHRAFRCDTALVEDEHARTRLLHFGEKVGAEQNRCSTLARDAAHERKHLTLSGRIEPERRLVEEHHLRLVDERPRDAEPLPHPPTVRTDWRATALAQTGLCQQRVCDRARTRFAVTEEARVMRSASLRACVEAVEPTDGQPGTLALRFEDDHASRLTNAALGELGGAGVPVLFFELEGARLSDAFLAMTEAA